MKKGLAEMLVPFSFGLTSLQKGYWTDIGTTFGTLPPML